MNSNLNSEPKLLSEKIRPLKKFNFNDCLKLKEKGYAYFGTDFCEREKEYCIILYPFKNKDAAKTFSTTNNGAEPLIIEINNELKDITTKLKDIHVYVQFL